MSLEIDGDYEEQLFSPISCAIPLWHTFLICLCLCSPLLFCSIYAQFLCWFLLNSFLNGASCLWEGSVGRGWRDGLGQTIASIWVYPLRLPHHISGFLCCGNTAQCLTLSGQCGPSQDSGEAVSGSQCSKPRIFG